MLRNGYLLIYYCGWIKNPHDKIALCACDKRNWVFWFNSDASFHGIGQILCDASDHPGCLTKACYLDVSSFKAMTDAEIVCAQSRGVLSAAFRARIVAALKGPNRRLSPANKAIALANLE